MASALLSLALLLSSASTVAPPAPSCEIGTYRFADGAVIDVGRSGGDALRWRRPDGISGALAKTPSGAWASTYGWTERPDGHRIAFDCAKDQMRFDGATGQRIAFDTVETRFPVDGTELAGRLVLPRGPSPFPVAILVHGAENASARDLYALQRLFPAAGIGAFVYDKRGTGASGGTYTHSYLTLATDAIAARREAMRLAGDRAGRVGYQAGSQGGWVAPLAAQIAGADFLIVGFGLAVSPMAGERELVAIDMAEHGHGPAIVAKAMEVVDAVEAVIVSDFQGGYDHIAAVRAKYGDEPWFAQVRGSVTAPIIERHDADRRAEADPRHPAPLRSDARSLRARRAPAVDSRRGRSRRPLPRNRSPAGVARRCGSAGHQRNLCRHRSRHL